VKIDKGGRPDNPADRPILSGNEEYEMRRLAAETGISTNHAWELIREHGLDRAALLEAARSMKAKGA